ncbi:MAG: hypothetical protein VBE63_25125 [Lamprobacter sp.]|nr:hypothetical protein [Lamprobacter sp.]
MIEAVFTGSLLFSCQVAMGAWGLGYDGASQKKARTLSSQSTKRKTMKGELTAIVKKDGDWWLGWIEEIPGANAQERTKDELLLSLREAVIDILELRAEEAYKHADKDFETIPLAL